MIQTDTGPENLSYEEYRARKKRRETTHTIVTDDDAAAAYATAKAQLDALPFNSTTAAREKLQQAMDAAETAMRDSAIHFRLRALPRKGDGSYAVLKAEHPPTDEDNARVQENTGDPKAKAMWHTETFAPALVAACLISPRMTVEQATAESIDMNDGEWDGLYVAAIDVNQQPTNTRGLVFS